MQTDTQARPAHAKAALVIKHTVKDYGAWRKVFDEHAATRAAAGIVSAHVNQDAQDPNQVTVYLAAPDHGALKAFSGSADLKATMERAGVVGAPMIMSVDIQEDLTVKQACPGALVIHDVADYATWKQAFDGHGATRAQAGITGHAVNRSADKPATVIVYLQAKSMDALQAFINSPDLKSTMQKAGVTSAPMISLVKGTDWSN